MLEFEIQVKNVILRGLDAQRKNWTIKISIYAFLFMHSGLNCEKLEAVVNIKLNWYKLAT